jgi:hypothetical protein
MVGLHTSDPFYLAWGTLGASLSALESAAMPWIDERIDTLIMDGDMDSDGDVDFDDIDDFVLGLTNPTQYESMFGTPATLKGDLDRDDDLDFDDIDDFVGVLSGTGSSDIRAVPEPGAGVSTWIGGVILSCWLGARRGRIMEGRIMDEQNPALS